MFLPKKLASINRHTIEISNNTRTQTPTLTRALRFGATPTTYRTRPTPSNPRRVIRNTNKSESPAQQPRNTTRTHQQQPASTRHILPGQRGKTLRPTPRLRKPHTPPRGPHHKTTQKSCRLFRSCTEGDGLFARDVRKGFRAAYCRQRQFKDAKSLRPRGPT